jgi:hypothetical protein
MVFDDNAVLFLSMYSDIRTSMSFVFRRIGRGILSNRQDHMRPAAIQVYLDFRRIYLFVREVYRAVLGDINRRDHRGDQTASVS